MSLEIHSMRNEISCLRHRKWLLVGSAVLGTVLISAEVVSRTFDLSIFNAEKDRAAPIVRGGAQSTETSQSSSAGSRVSALAAVAAAPFGGFGQVPTGGGTGGKFGPVLDWPIIAIHLALLPDGRVLSYGTGLNGEQGALVYDIWDPKKGVGPDSHTTLSNKTPTDIFCGTGTLVGPGFNNTTTSYTGKFLSLGGDLTVNGVRNFASADVALFNPANNSLNKTGTLSFARWYASTTTLYNGDKLLLGGQLEPGRGNITPSLFSPVVGWKDLSGAPLAEAQFSWEWYYPVAATGNDWLPYILQHNGKILKLTTPGTGTVTDTAVRMAEGSYFYPRVAMPVRPFVPSYRTFLVRNNKTVQQVDLANSLPIVTNLATPKWDRKWGTLTILANGHILATGGSGVLNELSNIAFESEIYRLGANVWLPGASAQIPRLYHSASLLLPDGSVLTAGGGAPGPQNNLNAEIYYPPYFYNGDGSLASRPTLVAAPSKLEVGKSFQLTVGPNDKVFGINLIRLGSQTHSYDPDARFVFAHYVQNGTTVTGFVMNDPKVMLPGYYMLFVVDSSDHPSLAKIVSIQPAVQ
jgi:hypothetical protein